MKLIGFWKEFRSPSHPTLLKEGTLKPRKKVIDNKIIEYLKNGYWLNKLRMEFKCPITDDEIGTPYIYTDGKFIWTTEFIYYLNKYSIKLPEDFLVNIETNRFKPPTKEDINEELLQEALNLVHSINYRIID